MAVTNQLALFLDVVQQGSFSKAAALHNMDNSSLSKQIKKLEAELGVQLLNRSTRSFSLTSAGEEILEQTYTLMETLNQIQNIADSYQSEPKGILRIVASVHFGQLYLQPVISRFMKKYPKVQISLSLDDRRTDIITDHFDIAFRIGKLEDSNLIARKLADTNFALVASEGFVQEYGMPQTPEALMELPSVIYSNRDSTIDVVELGEEPHSKTLKSYKMKGNYRASDVRSMLEAVKDGLGYTIIDLFCLERPIDELKLVPLLTNYHLSTMDTGIYAVYPHRKQTKLVTEFISAFQEHIGTPPFWERHIPGYKEMYK
ncbi:LysR family transcriptional regulator [Vibrio sp. JC009]|uniref:LysR family transcriptional regulator n=1 Tax=Vibrio sp. JC009 TaxID=2912314 RepID=UPI0023B0DD12|nr:LysR family transcriptional regulator [Vibrio sp. JC009]WED24322.1 LysR family transcriptional regulator [Vibrio sp. JC009]